MNPVEQSGVTPITWKLDGEESSVYVIVKKSGDEFVNITNNSGKGLTSGNLNQYVSLGEDCAVTVSDNILKHDISYTLNVDSKEARSGLPITDQLPAGFAYVDGSFNGTINFWDADGYNKQTAPFDFAPTVSDNSFATTIDTPANSKLALTYKVRVTDKSVLEAELTAKCKALNGAKGTFTAEFTNTANFGTVARTATGKISGKIKGISLGAGALRKTASVSTANVEVGEDNKLTPALPVTFTLESSLAQWTGASPLFELTKNVVLVDKLPAQSTWDTSAADFITSTGITLTQADSCPVLGSFEGDAFVGQYCVNGQTLMVNIGKDKATKAVVQAKALITTVQGLPKGSTSVVDASAFDLANVVTADFGANGGAGRSTTHTNLVVLPDGSEGYRDEKAFSKKSPAQTLNAKAGESIEVPFDFTVGAGNGIDMRASTIVDYVDASLFELGDLAALPISGKYGNTALNQSHFSLAQDADGNLLVTLSDAGKTVVDNQGVSKTFTMRLVLTTKPFDGKETMALKNKATLFGADGTPLYWSETTADATSYGTEAEVRKSLIDPNTGDSVETLDAVVDAEGNLVQNVYSYRVEFIPHGGFDNVAISDVEDVLPAETSFVGFVTAENAATAKNPVAGPISLNGNIEATYTEGVVKLVQKPGTKLQAGKPIEAYFAVKVNDKTAAPVINRIGNETEATIVPVASFNLSKTVVGAQQKNTAVPTTVDVTATWNEADESVSRVITVPTDGSATPFGINLPLGTEVTLTEAPLVDANGIAWGAPTWSGTGVTANDQGAATITIGEADNAGVKLENHAGNAFGSAKIEKKLEGGAAALVEADQEYVVTATIDAGDAQTTRAVNVRAGEPVPMDNLPVGATVTFSEVKPVDTDALTWATPVISPESITIESVQDEIPTITVTNSVERTVGTFSLTKTVAGEEAANSAVPESVEVTATWEQDGTPGSKVLKVPTDGTPVALGEKLLIGTKVTLTETAIADGSGIAWAAPSWGGTGVKIEANGDVTATIGHDAAAQVTLTNHAATSTGGISFIKQLTGDAVDAVPADTEFKVRASWDAGKGVESKDLTINTVTPTPLGEELPAGTVVTLTELERPEIAGVDWGSIVFSGEQVTPVDGESAQIFVSDQQGTTELLTVTNEATWSPGTFTISKQIEGIALDQAEVPATVTVQATWTDGADAKSRDIEIPTDGTPVPFGENLAYGTQVVLTETAVESSARMTWATPVWAVGEAEAQQNTSAEVIIGAATDTQVTLTNTAIATLGELSVSKLLTGSGTAEVPADAEFPVKATWSDLSGAVQERDLTVTTSTPAVITELPLGTEVSLSEGDLPDSATAKWLSAAWSSENDAVKVAADGIAATVTVTGDAGVSAAVALTNEYETGITPDPEDSNESIAPIDETTDPKDPKQDPKQGSNGSTEAPKQGQGNDLANTGSDMLAPLVGGGITLVLLGAGAVLLARRARKTA